MDSYIKYLDSEIELWNGIYQKAFSEPHKKMNGFRAAAKLGTLKNAKAMYLSLKGAESKEDKD